jgi:hypothetical protein
MFPDRRMFRAVALDMMGPVDRLRLHITEEEPLPLRPPPTETKKEPVQQDKKTQLQLIELDNKEKKDE